MKLLAIDTALNACSVAITDGGRTLARLISAGGKGHAERLLPLIEEARLQAGIALTALDGIAATIGPGSFTGIRTALATARGLGLALDRPVYGVTTTQALAAAAARPGRATVAVIDARRDEVYLQVFAAHDGEGPGSATTAPLLLALKDAAALLPAEPLTLVGSGSALLADTFGRADLHLSPVTPDPDPVIVARIAAAMPKPQAAPAPLYVRPPDAALPKAPQPRATLAVTIAPCGPDYAEAAAALHADAFPDAAWTAESLRDLIAMPGALALLASADDGQPAGFVLLRQAADEAEIITLAVTPRFRRLAVARRLLEAGFAELKGRGATRCFLEVQSDNRAARGLYLAMRFAEAGRRAAYYQTPAGPRDAVVMQRPL